VRGDRKMIENLITIILAIILSMIFLMALFSFAFFIHCFPMVGIVIILISWITLFIKIIMFKVG
jgi:hypothetical protein